MSIQNSPYAAFATLLAGSPQSVSPAELHGLLLGRSCAGAGFDVEPWLLDASDLLGEAPQDNVRQALIGLQEMVKGELAGDDIAIVLLPATMRHWPNAPWPSASGARAFAGFGLTAGDRALSSEAMEVLQDLSAIAQIQDSLEESEDGETDYMEVMEYLRAAPLLLFTECRRSLPRNLPCIEDTVAPMTRIPRSEYARRRKALMEQMEPNSIAILPAAPMYIRNRDVEHVYRQTATSSTSPASRAGSGDRPDSGPRAWRVRAVLPRARSRARALGRPACRAGRCHR